MANLRKMLNLTAEEEAYKQLRKGLHKEALQAFRNLPQKTVQSMMGEARCYIKLNIPQKAIELLTPLTKKAPEYGRLFTVLSSAYAGLGQYDKALEVLDACKAQSFPAITISRVTYLSHINTKLALQLFKKIKVTNKNEIELIILHGRIYEDCKEFESSKQIFREGLNKFPQDLSLRKAYAWSLFRLHDHVAAKQEIEKCLSYAQDDHKSKELLEKINYELNKKEFGFATNQDYKEQAKQVIDDLQKDIPVHVPFVKMVIISLREHGEDVLANKIVEIMQKQYADADILTAYLDLQISQKKYHDILPLANKIMSFKDLPFNKKTYVACRLAEVYSQTEKKCYSERSIGMLLDLIQHSIGAERISAQLCLINVYEHNVKDYDAAIHVSKTIIEENPDLWSKYLSYAVLCDQVGETQMSIEALNTLCDAYNGVNVSDKKQIKPTPEEYSQALVTLSIIYDRDSHVDMKLSKKCADMAQKTNANNDSAHSRDGHCIDDPTKRNAKFEMARSIRPERLQENHPEKPTVSNVSVVAPTFKGWHVPKPAQVPTNKAEFPGLNENKAAVAQQTNQTKATTFAWKKPVQNNALDSSQFPSLPKSNENLFKRNEEKVDNSKKAISKMNVNAKTFVPGSKKTS